jgi:hypothetical protein
MKNLVKISLIFTACLFLSGIVMAQQTTKQIKEAELENDIKNKIENRTYTFNANYVQPLRGTEHYLTSEYDLRVTRDSVIAYLPYFGQTYQEAPLTPEESGVMFTSTKFNYTVKPQKKGGWLITIIPSNVKFVSKMQLEVYKNGSANLMVQSNFRDEINFSGEIKQDPVKSIMAKN